MTDSHPMRGIVMAMIGLMLFACMDTTTKYLTATYDVPVIVACRYIVNLLLMVAIFAPTRHGDLLRTNRTRLVLLRGVCLSVASLLIGLAVARIPIAEATAIFFSAPILVVLAARPLLGEPIGALGWVAALLGFGGVLLIARPGAGLDPTGVIFALSAVLLNAAYQLLSRLLVATEKTAALMFYTALVGVLAYGFLLPIFWDGRWPTAFEAALLVSLGINGGLGHFLFTAAFRYTPASVLAPVTYMQMVWAGLLGWIVFGDVPGTLGLIGIAIVCAAGILVALKTRRPPPRRSA